MFDFNLQVFGRGGEEMDFLRQQGIQVKVIPGNADDHPNLYSWVNLVF